MPGITGLASNRFRRFSAMLLCLLFFSGPHAVYAAAQSAAARQNLVNRFPRG